MTPAPICARCRTWSSPASTRPGCAPKDCGICRGSDNRAAVEQLVQVLCELGLVRLVVVGGSPAARTELRTLMRDRLDLRLIDGKARRTGPLARADLRWADLVMVWGSTMLDHRVSLLYTGPKVRTLHKRGIAALCQEAIGWAVRRRQGPKGG